MIALMWLHLAIECITGDFFRVESSVKIARRAKQRRRDNVDVGWGSGNHSSVARLGP